MVRKNGHPSGGYWPAADVHRPEPGHNGVAYDSDRAPSIAPSDRTVSEFVVANERIATPHRSARRHHHSGSRPSSRPSSRPPSVVGLVPNDEREGSDILYVTNGVYRAPSEISHYSYRSYRSGAPSEVSKVSTAKTRTSRKAGVMVETMSAPNPFCPNTKGICCLMVLINLGLILITLGFTIVLQFFEPLIVWILGIIFLVFGFLTLLGSLIYCVYVCRDNRSPSEVSPQDLYWTHHWQKNIRVPEIHYQTEERYPPADDRYSVSKYSDRQSKYSDRNSKYSDRHSKYSDRNSKYSERY